jgi:hypothetical protein
MSTPTFGDPHRGFIRVTNDDPTLPWLAAGRLVADRVLLLVLR